MMSDDSRTRRDVLQRGTTLAAAGLLAGCTSSGNIAGNDGEDGGDGGNGGSDGESTTTTSGYSVSIEPMGEVGFDAVPETWVANNGSWADMGIALGRDAPEGVWLPSRYHTQYYDGIPGVSVDGDGLTALYQDGVSKETFYTLDGDLHVMDPNFVTNRFELSQSDVGEIRNQIAPMFGNSIFSSGYEWHQDYRYYTLYEAFEKLAAVFREEERYEAFATLHDEFQSTLDDAVPPEGNRPAVAIMWAGGDEPETFSPYLIGEGTSFKQWRDLGVRDALAETDVQDFHETRGRVDFETLLDIDPPHLMFRGQEGKTEAEFRNTVVSYMEGHDVASDLTAVKEGNVHRGGPLYQGPITNLVVTERTARQVYGVEDNLFDRERVGDIVAGDI
jgi:iron complex transport system substrate-binding protein